MTRRIAILDANTDDSAYARRFPDDGQKVAAGLRPLRPHWQYDVWPVKDGVFPPDPCSYDGWVLTGSVASVNDDAPWMVQLAALLRELHARRAALVGLCFGHQMIAKALGGSVGRSPGGWRLGVARTRFAAARPWMEPFQEQVSLYAAHEEQVLTPPPTAMAHVLGGDDFAPVGSLAVADHIFTTQYHPELSREFLQGVLDEFGDDFPATVVARARVQFEQPVDAALFMRWMAQFLEMPRHGGP